MTKKTVLVCTDWYAPGFRAGGPIRSCVNFVHHMKDTYNLHVLTGDRDFGSNVAYEGIAVNQWVKYEGCNIFYASPGKQRLLFFAKLIRELAPDFIYLNSMFSFPFTINILLLKRFGLIKGTIILAPRGMLRSSALQFKSLKKSIFIKLFRSLRIGRGVRWHATDETELIDIGRKFPGGEAGIFLIPNLPGGIRKFEPVVKKEVGSLDAIFVGRIHPVKHLDFLLNALTHVHNKVNLTVVGAVEDEAYFAECQKLADKLNNRGNIRFLRDIQHEKLETILREHHLFILPTKGENFGHAIFEALSVGRPVLISDQTPWRELVSKGAGWDLPIGDERMFARVIDEVAQMDEKNLNQLCEGAWTYCNNYINVGVLKNKYITLFT